MGKDDVVAGLPGTAYGTDYAAGELTTWLYDVSAIQGKEGYFAAGNHSTTEIQALGLSEVPNVLKRFTANDGYYNTF